MKSIFPSLAGSTRFFPDQRFVQGRQLATRSVMAFLFEDGTRTDSRFGRRPAQVGTLVVSQNAPSLSSSARRPHQGGVYSIADSKRPLSFSVRALHRKLPCLRALQKEEGSRMETWVERDRCRRIQPE